MDRGELGVATLAYQGGVPKGIRAIRFPEPKVHPDKPGRPAVVQTADRDVKKAHKVTGLVPLYVFAMLLVSVSNNLGILWIAVWWAIGQS